MSDFLPFIVAGLTAGSVYALAGTGLVLTYKTAGIFNFAHGTIAALVAFAFYDLRQVQGLPWPIAIAICLLVLAPIAALLLERIARRVADAPVVRKVVATVGLLVVIQQLIIIRYGSPRIQMDPFLPTTTYRIGGVNVGADQLIVMVIALAGMAGLTLLFSSTRLGRQMRAVVEQPDLVAMTGTSPIVVRRRAWFIGVVFAGISGVMLAPTVGLESTILTLLVVQSFGAAALGLFTSIPLTYVGGLVIGVVASVSTKYVATVPSLNGLPSSLPFIVLFTVLVVAPKDKLKDVASEVKPRLIERRALSPRWRAARAAAVFAVALGLPQLVGHRLPVYTSGLAFAIIFLSLLLLMRTSGQVSLAQLAFAAVGASTSSKLIVEAGLPWMLGVLVGALAAVPVGAILAVPAIRRSGLYLALATFGFAVLLERLVIPTSLMFGAIASGLPSPRPDFAAGDRAFYYLMLGFLTFAGCLVTLVRHSRLGRLLRAMSDSTTALTTYGMSVTVLKLIVFCLAAFLAGLGGALLGPVTGAVAPSTFIAFNSLVLVVIAVIAVGNDVTAASLAAFAYIVLPSYRSGGDSAELFQLAFGSLAILVAVFHTGIPLPAWLARAAERARPSRYRDPIRARVLPSPGAP